MGHIGNTPRNAMATPSRMTNFMDPRDQLSPRHNKTCSFGSPIAHKEKTPSQVQGHMDLILSLILKPGGH